MMSETMLYIGSIVIILWGIAHLIPTKAIVAGFEPISADNKKIITMESIAEGLTLCFIGILVLLVTCLGRPESQTADIVYVACIVMLVTMAVLTQVTGAKIPVIWFKICPYVKTFSAVLFFLGSWL